LKPKVAFLGSGTGKLLQAMLTAFRVEPVVVDRQCEALDTAKQLGLPIFLEEPCCPNSDAECDRYTHALVRHLQSFGANLVSFDTFRSSLSCTALRNYNITFLKGVLTSSGCYVRKLDVVTGRWLVVRSVTIPRRKSHTTDADYQTSIGNALHWLYVGNPQPVASTFGQ
jgi:hypothetical protein